MPRAGPRTLRFRDLAATLAAVALAAGACADLTGLPDLGYRGEGRYLTPVAGGPASGGDVDPVVSGSLIVWRDGETGGLHAYDLDRDTSRVLVSGRERSVGHDAQDGRLVWAAATDSAAGASSGTTRLELMSLATGSVRPIAADSSRKVAPSLWADRVVWEDHRHGNAEIYLRDLDSGETRRLTDSPESDREPVVWRHHVAWVRGRRGRVHLLDLTSGRHDVMRRSVATSGPDLEDGHLVWEDRRGPSWDVYHYDLESERQRRLGEAVDVADHGSDQRDPRVSGKTVVWRDTRWGPDDIYLYDLAEDAGRLVNTGSGDHRTDPDISDRVVTWVGTGPRGAYGLYALLLQ